MPKKKPQQTDEQKLLGAKSGDQTVIGQVLCKYATDRRFYNMAYRILRNKEDAEDAVQEAHLQALRKWHQFRGDSKFSTWFTRIVITSALMMQRGKPEFVEVREDMISHNGIEKLAILNERRERLFDAIEGLASDVERNAIRIRVTGDLTLRELSQLLGCPLGTAKTFILRAKAHLKEALKDQV